MRLIDADKLLNYILRQPVIKKPEITMTKVAYTHLREQIPSWIPRFEKLPNEYTEVLLTLRWGAVTIGHLDNRETTKCWSTEEGEYEFEDVTAWMPLPRAYEVEE